MSLGSADNLLSGGCHAVGESWSGMSAEFRTLMGFSGATVSTTDASHPTNSVTPHVVPRPSPVPGEPRGGMFQGDKAR